MIWPRWCFKAKLPYPSVRIQIFFKKDQNFKVSPFSQKLPIRYKTSCCWFSKKQKYLADQKFWTVKLVWRSLWTPDIYNISVCYFRSVNIHYSFSPNMKFGWESTVLSATKNFLSENNTALSDNQNKNILTATHLLSSVLGIHADSPSANSHVSLLFMSRSNLNRGSHW